jgi:peptidoglycan/LPS O-acetylase OafA/YrhL
MSDSGHSPQHVQGESAAGARLLSLQACRGLAALFVTLHHLGAAIAAPKYSGISAFAIPFSSGHQSVPFFFALSSFTIVYAHWRDFGRPQRLGSFIAIRAGAALAFLLTLAGCVGAGLLLYRWVERPLLQTFRPAPTLPAKLVHES